MWRIFSLLFLLLLVSSVSFAQAPDSINYQAVARDDQGEVLADEDLDVRMSIYAGGPSGTLVYEEEHNNVSTDGFGLFTLHIGGGSQTGGSAASFDAIGWGNDEHFIDVQVNAGNGYESLGSRKFVSVPYALYAGEAGSGGGGTLQDAYEGGNTITVDTSSTGSGPLLFQSSTNQPFFYGDEYRIGVGTTTPIENVRMDMEYDGASGPGPALLVASAPISIPDSVYDRPFFKQVHSGVLGVGAGSGRSIGVTGFTTHTGLTSALQDSIYGVTGIANDQDGAMAAVGVSGITQSFTNNAQRGVGVYGMVDDEIVTDYQSDPLLAGGVFEANIDPGHTSLDSTFGVIGLSGYGGRHAVGVYGVGRGDPGATSEYTYGVIGQAGVAQDTNVGVHGVGNPAAAGQSLAAWFRGGKTLIEDTLQVAYGNPDSGEVLMAIDGAGNAVWDSVPSGGTPTPITLEDAYSNGSDITLDAGSPFNVMNNAGGQDYLYMEEGNPSVAVGHSSPIGSAQGMDVTMHLANSNSDHAHLFLSSGANNNGEGGTISFSENLTQDHAGASIQYRSYDNWLLFNNVPGGSGDNVMGITLQSSSLPQPKGVAIGMGYAGMANPPNNGLLVEDTVGIGTTTPSHKHHVEGRSYSSKGFMTHDTAEYRYEAPKTRYQGIAGHEFRPSGDVAASNQMYSVTGGGAAYFDGTLLDSCQVSVPLDLPDGAKIIEIRVFMHDNVAGDDIQLVLESIPYGNSPAPTQIASYTSTGTGDEDHLFSFGASPIVVDNENQMYRLRAVFSAGNGTDLRLENAKVQYQVEKAD